MALSFGLRMPRILNGQAVSSTAFSLARRCFASQTGTVKFYTREKGYGFITPDSGEADVFVHRSGLQSDVSVDVSFFHPYLRKGERVRYETVPENGLIRAAQVSWVNGSTIPPLRKNFLGSLHENARRELGEHCFSILSDESLSPDEKLTKVQDAYLIARHSIEKGEQLIQILGMKVEDFPTIATDQPGRYQFERSEESEDEIEEEIK